MEQRWFTLTTGKQLQTRTPVESKSALLSPHPPPRLSSSIVHVALMSLQDDFDGDVAWAAAAPVALGDILRDSMKKEVIVK